MRIWLIVESHSESLNTDARSEHKLKVLKFDDPGMRLSDHSSFSAVITLN